MKYTPFIFIITAILVNFLGVKYILYQNYQIVRTDSKMYLSGYAKGYSDGTDYGMKARQFWDNYNPDNNVDNY